MAAALRRPSGSELVKPPPTQPDYQEVAALDEATQAVINFMPGCPQAKALATVAISAWIVSRTRQASRNRLAETLVFDLSPARYRGYVESALPQIGGALSHLPADVPFFGLPKASVVDVFVAGLIGVREAAIAAGESSAFPFDDEVPFG
jgi:hypothetical protein